MAYAPETPDQQDPFMAAMGGMSPEELAAQQAQQAGVQQAGQAPASGAQGGVGTALSFEPVNPATDPNYGVKPNQSGQGNTFTYAPGETPSGSGIQAPVSWDTTPKGGKTNDTASGGMDSLESMLMQLIQSSQADKARGDAQRQGLTDTINRTIAEAEKPVSPEDPSIAGPTQAFNAEGQRARKLLQEQRAQRASAMGETTGSVEQGVAQDFENLGNATGSYKGSLMVNELNNRRAELMAAIQAGAGLLDAGTTARLQEELTAINGRIASQGQRNQHQQFYDTFSSGLSNQENSLDKWLADRLGSGGDSMAA